MKDTTRLASALELLEQLTKGGMQNGAGAKVVRAIADRAMFRLFGRAITWDSFGFPCGLKVNEWDQIIEAREELYQERRRLARAQVDAARVSAGLVEA